MTAPRLSALTRRHFLVAAAAAAVVAPARAERWQWRGTALGGEARIVLDGARDDAGAAIIAARDEIERLENLFSLYRPQSQLATLNREGRLDAPARDLRRLLMRAEAWRSKTEGAFDARVQPLWSSRAAGSDGPDALRRVAATRVAVDPGSVSLSKGGALTLNGIAQGTITDCIAGVLARYGFRPRLIDTGEMRVGQDQSVIFPAAGLRSRLDDRAVATSAPDALRFAPDGHHLFDPATGVSPDIWRSVTVLAPDAETADVLSTAFAVSVRERIGDLTPPDITVLATDRAGQTYRFGRPETVRAI